jgi:triacylglycerol esterase/lipase EstA (alpha/beta hydrolase family)
VTTLFFLGLVLGGAVTYAAIAKSFVSQGYPLWWFIIGAPFAYFVLPLSLVSLWFVLSRIWRAPTSDGRLRVSGYFHMVVHEVLTVAISWPVMAFHQTFIRDPIPKPANVPILLIHGVFNNDGVWLKFRHWFARHNISPVYTINCGPPLADIETFADQLAEKIGAVLKATGAAHVTLIGHSMGGLISRAYLRRYGGGRVAQLVTIGTPHHGSMFAVTLPGRSLAQMRPGNAWLAELNRTSDRNAAVPITSIWSWHDTMVAPQTSADLIGAKNIALIGIAHNALLRDRNVFAEVLAQVEPVRAEYARHRPASSACSAR